MGSLALGVGTLLVFALTLPVFQSSEGEAPGPEIVGQLVPAHPSVGPASAGAVLPRPRNVEEIVAGTDVISDIPGRNTVAPQAPNAPDTEPDVVRQDESAALAPDTALTAKQTGLPVASVERAIAFQQAFGRYVDELIARFPDQISAVWTEPVPNTRGHVRFTGKVPPEVTSGIERQGLLDPNNVVITGWGMISRADHSRRSELAAEALVDLGYWNFITFFDPIDNVISIELQLPEGASQPSKLDLVGAVQNRVQADRDQRGEARFQGRAATVDALDLELTVITGSGPIITAEGGPASDAPLAQDRPGPSGSPGEDTPPVIPGGAPLVRLTFEGTVYYQDPLSTDAAANLKEDDLELVGITTESNLLAPGGGESLDIYRLKNDEDGYVYTLEPEHEQSVQDEGEDGHIITITTTTIEPEWVRWIAADSNQTAPVRSGMMVPRPTTAEELVARADIIAVGTIMSVLGERLMGPYGEEGQPLPAGEDGLPYTDYDVRVEGVLKGDQRVEALVLRMFGHLNNPNAIITPNVFTLPNPGDHLLFALGRNPDGTYGSGPEGLLDLQRERVTYADGAPFGADISPEQLKRNIADAISGSGTQALAAKEDPALADTLPGTSPAASTRPSHGTPPPQASSPQPSLKFEGVEYVHTGYAEPVDGAQTFAIDGRRST